MNQEFRVGNLKLIEDEDGYAVMRQVEDGIFEPIATFKYPEDAIHYFNNIIMEAVAYIQNNENKKYEKNNSN